MTNAVATHPERLFAIEMIAARLPFYVVHKHSYGRVLYLTDDATWSRDIERASAFHTAEHAMRYVTAIKRWIVEGSEPAPVEYFKNGTVGVG